MRKINEIYRDKKEEKIIVKGWMVSNRGNEKIRFININDGSFFKNLQVVIKGDINEGLNNLRIGSAIEVKGKINLTPNSKQSLELQAEEINYKNVDEDFPLQKKEMSFEFLRDIPHLRHRTNIFRASFRIRSSLMFEIHNFLNKHNFLNVTTPAITGNDAEGAGEAFLVDSPDANFFNKKAALSVSGQLHAESFSTGFGDVYTFGPTFRAENSHTKKHAAEFWMLEAEMAYWDKIKSIKFLDKMLKTIIKKVLVKHEDVFEYLDSKTPGLIEKLNIFLNKDIKIITYKEAINKLYKLKDNFEEQNIVFGLDLGTEHERYLAEKIYAGPVAVIDYPKDIKAFYMKVNNDKETAGAFDILVPGIGELIGGSEREDDYQKLVTRISEMNLDFKDLEWYADLRRYGQKQSTGFGLGFSRLVMYVTGMDNIRDVIAYPRTPNNLKM